MFHVFYNFAIVFLTLHELPSTFDLRAYVHLILSYRIITIQTLFARQTQLMQRLPVYCTSTNRIQKTSSKADSMYAANSFTVKGERSCCCKN
jgi:hypothetical protein